MIFIIHTPKIIFLLHANQSVFIDLYTCLQSRINYCILLLFVSSSINWKQKIKSIFYIENEIPKKMHFYTSQREPISAESSSKNTFSTVCSVFGTVSFINENPMIYSVFMIQVKFFHIDISVFYAEG